MSDPTGTDSETAMDDALDESAFVAALDRRTIAHPGMGAVEAGLLAVLDLGLTGDSRAFARTFAVEHALVLRALATLEEAGHVAVTARGPRPQRPRYAAAPDGSRLAPTNRPSPPG